MRILVVDDDPNVLRIISAMLRRWGYEVIVAHDVAHPEATLPLRLLEG